MLATLLIIRQFLQNVKEVLQPYLYERHKLGDLTLRAVWDLLMTALMRYMRLAAGKAQLSPSDPTVPGQGPQGTRLSNMGRARGERREKKCLNGGCGVPDDDEEATEEEESGRMGGGGGGGGGGGEENEEENESLMDCGLKLRKVSFMDKVDQRKVASASLASPPEDNFLEEGSPTMVEKGMDPASVFEMCDDDDDKENSGSDGKELGSEPIIPAAALAGSHEGAATSSRHRRRNRSLERANSKTKRDSWIEPPEERESTTLTQAEIESCMQKYEVDTFTPYLHLISSIK